MKKNICVIFTGGTIGSDAQGNSVNLAGERARKLLLELYEKTEGEANAARGTEICFDSFAPVDMLSENVTYGDLDSIVRAVDGVDCDRYDGVVITHGTDTLSFTAGYLSEIFYDYPLPIVFVSSLYPLTDGRANGLANFKGAVDFIVGTGLNGVYVSFKNYGENTKIHLASRLIFCDELSGEYRSVYNAHFAELRDGKTVFNSSPLLPSREEIEKLASREKICRCDRAGLSDEIMLVSSRSLLNYALYDFSRVKPKAAVIELYHSGTACTVDGAHRIFRFAEYCKEQGVQLVAAPVDSRANVYGAMDRLADHMIVARDVTLEMTLIKVMRALACGKGAEAFLNSDGFFSVIRAASAARKPTV